MSYSYTRDLVKMDEAIKILDRTYEKIARIVVENPYCFDGNQRKAEVIQALQNYVEGKVKRSNDGKKASYNTKLATDFMILIEEFEGGKVEYAAKLAGRLFEMSITDLKYIPEELKKTALEITRDFLEKLTH